MISASSIAFKSFMPPYKLSAFINGRNLWRFISFLSPLYDSWSFLMIAQKTLIHCDVVGRSIMLALTSVSCNKHFKDSSSGMSFTRLHKVACHQRREAALSRSMPRLSFAKKCVAMYLIASSSFPGMLQRNLVYSNKWECVK